VGGRSTALRAAKGQLVLKVVEDGSPTGADHLNEGREGVG